MTWMADHNQPITYEILTKLATDILRKRNPHSQIDKSVSRSWCKRFLRRHNLSQRRARHIERSRIIATASFDAIQEFFKVLDQLHLQSVPPTQIFNMDEVGWSKQQTLQRPVLLKKGVKQATVQQVYSNQHITSVHTICASGKSLPPHIIFSKNIPNNIDVNHLPSGWTYSSTDSGYMDSATFSGWFQKNFLKHIGKERPVVLIIDPASSHFNVNVLEQAQREHISIVTIPAKTSHMLQPVDQIVATLKETFSNEAYKCSLVKASFLARPAQFPNLLKCALQICWTEKTVQQAFAQTGIM